MPFASSFPRAFSVRSIRTHAPASPGVYGISNARHWILIRRSENIQTSLMAHLLDTDGTVNSLAPAGFVFEACEPGMQTLREDRLVLEYDPLANRVSRP